MPIPTYEEIMLLLVRVFPDNTYIIWVIARKKLLIRASLAEELLQKLKQIDFCKFERSE